MIVDDLVDDLLDRWVDGAPLVGKEDRLAADDMVAKVLQQVVGVLGKSEEGLAGELDAKGFELEGVVFDGHVKIFRVHDVVMATDQMKVSVKLAIMETIVALQAEVQTDNVSIGTAGAEGGMFVEFGDGVAHPDTVEFPGDGFAGAGISCAIVALFHSLKIRVPGLAASRTVLVDEAWGTALAGSGRG